MDSIKHKLHLRCKEFLDKRRDAIRQAMHAAQSSANEETKSSAGDKYETTRAMLQLDMEKLAAQLDETSKLYRILEQINSDVVNSSATLGAIVKTNQANFYISISAGEIVLDDEKYLAISPATPIAQKLRALIKGDIFSFNNRDYKVLEIL